MQFLRLQPKHYYLATLHRAENTDQPDRLAGIWEGLRRLSKTRPVVLPLHPRTRHALQQWGLSELADAASGNNGLRIIEPVGFLDMIRLEQEAALILTDSGGVQKEAYFHRVPCVTLREETEWVETVQTGWNRVVGANPDRIAQMTPWTPLEPIVEYGDGQAAGKVVAYLLQENSL
ncbi:MAG TPA: UDP-N-acetylglucosamine 2-epimerase [Thermoguttaceae bacterium]|nr:UDP-N-acetylglucosamine 2-epimerase [Thermoguttaceae bacterium]